MPAGAARHREPVWMRAARGAGPARTNQQVQPSHLSSGVETMKLNKLHSLVCGAVLAGLTLAAPLAHASKGKADSGCSIDDMRVERWARDRDYFIAAAENLGAKVSVQSADASEERQISQIENLIPRGVGVIGIGPFNS